MTEKENRMDDYFKIHGACVTCGSGILGKVAWNWTREMPGDGCAEVHSANLREVIGHVHADGDLVCPNCTGSKERVYGPWLHALHEDGAFLACDITKGGPGEALMATTLFGLVFEGLAWHGFDAKTGLSELIRAGFMKLGGEEHGAVAQMGFVALAKLVIRDMTGTPPPIDATGYRPPQ